MVVIGRSTLKLPGDPIPPATLGNVGGRITPTHTLFHCLASVGGSSEAGEGLWPGDSSTSALMLLLKQCKSLRFAFPTDIADGDC